MLNTRDRTGGLPASPWSRGRALLVAPLAAFLGWVLWSAIARPNPAGDSHGLSLKAVNIVHCLGRGQFTFCDRRPSGHIGGVINGVYKLGNVGPFPLLQYLIATPLRALHVGTIGTTNALIAVNAVALVVTIVIGWGVLERLDLGPWPPLLALAIVVSPLPWYSTIAFGEVLASLALLLVVVGVLRGWSPVVLTATVALGCITKETSPPFVIAFAALAASVPGARVTGREQVVRRQVVPVLAGVAVGVVLNSLFNVFRFGSISNRAYLSLASPRWPGQVAGNALNLMVHRNGGLLWFWPALLAVLVLTTSVGLLGARTIGERLRSLGAPAIFAANILGLASWNSPFGWIAWGPRLALPVGAPLLVVSIAAAGRRGADAVARVLRSRWIVVLGGVLVVAGLPQVGWSRNSQIVRRNFLNHVTCPPQPRTSRLSPAEFCRQTVTGKRIPVILDSLHTLGTPLGATAGVLLVATIVGLLALARQWAGPVAGSEAPDGGVLSQPYTRRP